MSNFVNDVIIENEISPTGGVATPSNPHTSAYGAHPVKEKGGVNKLVDYIRNLGMSVHGTFTYGLPGETKDQMLETKKFIYQLTILQDHLKI